MADGAVVGALAGIDIHSHFFPETWPDLDALFGGEPWPRLHRTGADTATVMLGARPFREIDSRCWDVARRIADMDRDGIALQVISATPVLFAYGRPADQAAAVARLFNDAALEMAGRSRGRITCFAQLPMQDTDAACVEAERAKADGHLGVQIGSHVGARELDDEGVLTLLQHCAALGLAVLVHPWEMLGAERMGRFMLPWTVGMPAETQLAIVSLILGGGFERLPASLRLCFAHGGGSFAFLLGRLDNAWTHKESIRGRSTRRPSAYCDRIFVDSAVFDADALALLAKKMGPDRIVLGSDYPFPLGEAQVGRLVREGEGLSPALRRGIMQDNARAFLGLGPLPQVAA